MRTVSPLSMGFALACCRLSALRFTHGTIIRMSGRSKFRHLHPWIATKQETVCSKTSGGMRRTAVC